MGPLPGCRNIRMHRPFRSLDHLWRAGPTDYRSKRHGTELSRRSEGQQHQGQRVRQAESAELARGGFSTEQVVVLDRALEAAM